MDKDDSSMRVAHGSSGAQDGRNALRTMSAAQFTETKRVELEEEARKATKERLWDCGIGNNDKAAGFVEKLVQTGSLEKAKNESGCSSGIPPLGNVSSASMRRTDSQRGADAARLNVKEFIRCAAKFSRECKTTQELSIHINLRGKTEIELEINDDEQNVEEQLGNIRVQTDIVSILMAWKRKDEEKKSFWRGKEIQSLNQAELDEFFDRSNEKLHDLEKFLKERLIPLACKSPVMEPNTAFVISEPPDPNEYFSRENMQADKSYAIVVAGESGSGKSVFVCQQSLNCGFLPLYIVLKRSHFNSVEPPILDRYKVLNELFQLVINETSDKADLEALYEFKKRLNTSRDEWARKILERAMHVQNEVPFLKWLDGRWDKKNRPEKVAIIVDEATDINLAEGLISSVREITAKYSRLAKKQVQLVLAGVGLDAIMERGHIGTNPEYSQLVVMKGPNTNEIMKSNPDKFSEAISYALNHGVYARVLKTNTRMFFRSVLPMLQLPYHEVDLLEMEPERKKMRYTERLVNIASCGDFMDHAPRFYVAQLGELPIHSLLLQSFAHHLVRSMEDVKNTYKQRDAVEAAVLWNLQRELDIVTNFKDYKRFHLKPLENIFARGLACRRGTSNALKFLACFGSTCDLRPTFSDEFEEITALHFMRYMEAQGYESQRVTLHHAWPPPPSKAPIDSQLQTLNETLEEQKGRELENLKQFWQVTPETGKFCIVFSQRTACAQAGDVFALLLDVDDKKAELETIQCKNYAKKPTESKECCDWWNSLGVDFANNDLCPKSGAAGYSFTGVNSFRELVKEWLSLPVELGKRTMAMSFSMPKEFPIPKNESCRAWFREMFEPTISVLPGKARHMIENDN